MAAPAAVAEVVAAVAPEDQAVELALKLANLARAQEEALRRDAREQFAWLGLRRRAVMEKIDSLVAGGLSLTQEQVRIVNQARSRMRETDDAMERFVEAQLDATLKAKGNLARHRKAMSPYLLSDMRTPAFVDRRG